MGVISAIITGINPAEIEVDGIPASSIVGHMITELIVPAGEIEIEGIPASSMSGCVEILINPAELEVEGIIPLVGGEVIVSAPAEIEVEGIAPTVAFTVSTPPAEIEIDGIPAVSVSGSGVELVLDDPAEIEIEGIAPALFIYNTYAIACPPAEIGIEGVPAVSVGGWITVTPAEIAIEGVVPVVPVVSPVTSMSLSETLFVWDEPTLDLSLLISEALVAVDSPTFQLCLILADYIKAIDALSAQQSLTMRASDTIYAVDSVDRIAIIAATLTDAIAIVDAPAFIITALISDYMTTRDAVSHNLTGTKTISDTIAVTDAVVAGWLLGLIESLDIADVVNNLRENTLSISETATISEVLTGLGVYGVRIQDAAGISDYAQTIVELLISESLVATDTTTYLKDIYLALAETLGATDALVASLNVYLSLTDNLVAIDTASNTGVFGVTITEGLKIDVSVEIDGELFECYVLSTPKFLPSIYSGFNFNSYCEFQGRAFGANATGIFELTGDTDNGTTIHTGATFHETDFGARNDKRFRKAYLGVSGTSPVMIMETGEGERTVYSIDDKGKVDASRSVHSRDWTLSVSDFDELDTVHLVPVILARGK